MVVENYLVEMVVENYPDEMVVESEKFLEIVVVN